MTSIHTTPTHSLDDLFPAPSLPPSNLSPQRLPGANLESLAAVQEVLKDNHRRYHIFFNPAGSFHNHITHRALAVYALGGSAAVIKDYYKRDSVIQRPAFESPEAITEDNFIDHLGDHNFYQAYVSFFSKQIAEKGVARTLEEFLFSEKYNFQEGRNANAQPEMLGRFPSGLVHPLIHVGYGAEFGLKGMIVEGLALTAAHAPRTRQFLSSSLFAQDTTNDAEIASRFSSLALDVPATTIAPAVSKMGGVHAFDIAARILKDDRLNRRPPSDFVDHYNEVLNEYSLVIREHAEQWTVDLSVPGEVERKMEELIWLSSLIYGVGGLKPNGHQSDFFLMHLVTSSLFLPPLIAYLSPRSQVLLFRAYLASALVWWVMQGRPALEIKSFMATTSIELSISPTPTAQTPLSTETTPTPNPFLPILQSVIAHPNDHMPKIQRAFAHFDTLYGTRPTGYFAGTELEGAELLDGSLFLRNALLTADSVGWVREGKEPQPFSTKGFYV